MVETFGNFIEPGETLEYLIISFSSSTLSIHERWRNNSLSADFLAEYWGTFFPASDRSTKGRNEVRDAVGYIANELLENAIKFNYEKARKPVKIGLYLSDSELRFYVTNSVAPDSVEAFKGYIREIMTQDPDELYIRQIERNAENETEDSRLGFLTMINDYGARMGWRFEKDEIDQFIYVTTMTLLPIVRSR